MKGRKADVIMAAHLASEAALRLVKPGSEVSYLEHFPSPLSLCESYLGHSGQLYLCTQ